MILARSHHVFCLDVSTFRINECGLLIGSVQLFEKFTEPLKLKQLSGYAKFNEKVTNHSKNTRVTHRKLSTNEQEVKNFVATAKLHCVRTTQDTIQLSL